MALSASEHDDLRDGPVSLANLARNAARLDGWLVEHRRLHPGMDLKAAAAFMVGGIARELGEAVAPALLTGRPSLLPGPDSARLRLAWAVYEEDGATEPAITYRVQLGGREAAPSPEALRIAFEATHAPLIAALVRRTGLGRSALWRLVTDSLAAALLEVAQEAGELASGMDIARATLGDRASPLFNRQWRFFEVEARRPDGTPNGRPVHEWFRARGGCCRYYTTDGGEYCSTCVLRDPESRDERLRRWLATRPEPGPEPAQVATPVALDHTPARDAA